MFNKVFCFLVFHCFLLSYLKSAKVGLGVWCRRKRVKVRSLAEGFRKGFLALLSFFLSTI